jgi:hypothetical protein
VEGDPTSWGLRDAAVAVAPWLSANAPVPLAVTTPVSGTLLLAPKCAGSSVLRPLPPAHDWIPCEKLAAPYLYLPTTTGLAVQQWGYALAADTSLDALQQQILTAMTEGTQLPVQVTIEGAPAIVVLSGASLPFVVLAEATAFSPAPA